MHKLLSKLQPPEEEAFLAAHNAKVLNRDARTLRIKGNIFKFLRTMCCKMYGQTGGGLRLIVDLRGCLVTFFFVDVAIDSNVQSKRHGNHPRCYSCSPPVFKENTKDTVFGETAGAGRGKATRSAF